MALLDVDDVIASPENLLAHYRAVRARLQQAGPPVISAPRAISPPRAFAPPPPDDGYVAALPEPETRRGVMPVSASRILSTITVAEIVALVSEAHEIPVVCLKSSRRAAAVVIARQEAMWLAKKFTYRSYPDIGRQMGGRDHTTVIHGVRRVEERIAKGGYEPKALAVVEARAAEILQVVGGRKP